MGNDHVSSHLGKLANDCEKYSDVKMTGNEVRNVKEKNTFAACSL